jgi:predicted extracellular nuclease
MKKVLFTLFMLPAFGAFAQIANHVVISEIYGGGGNSGATFTNDFIELYNPTPVPVSLAGWSVQYASATGSSWQKTDLNGTMPAYGFFLVHGAAGAGGTTALPAPDVTGTLALGATGGKLALVNNNTALSGTCPTGAQIIDFVGFATTANCNEGGANSPAPGNTTSVERKASAVSTAATLATAGIEALAGNGYDSNINGSDFVVQSAINPQNSSSTEGGIAGNAVTAAAGINAAEPATNGSFTITLNTAAPVGGITVTYSLAGTATAGNDYTDAGSGSILIPEAATSATVSINVLDDANAEGNETIVLTLLTATGGYTVSPATATINITDNDITTALIHTIQGSGTAAVAGTYTSEAIVTGVYPFLSPAGFYIQEEDADADADPATSEGIFVVSAATVAVGDWVRVTGTVQENAATPSFSQAVFTAPVVTVLNNNVALPSLTDITLPLAAADYERYEGMLVRFPATLTVTNNYTLGRFGEVGLSAGGSVYQPSQVIDPNDASPDGTTTTGTSNVPAINALISSNNARTILLDDGTNTTVTLPYADPVDHTLRLGSTISNLTGIMGYAFNVYRIQPVPSAPPTFTYAARPALPAVGAGNIRVASFNVLNYFNGNGTGGGFPTERGANSLAEFNRQRAKIISAITQINADVVGLLEMENDGTGTNSAIQDLVNGLNTVLGTGTYSFVNDGASIQTYGTDAIRCGLIYKSASVTPVGAPMLSASDSFNRPPLVQTFNVAASGELFNFAVNHFKSKGCTSSTGADTDQLDGQACYNDRRKKQAVALLNFFNNTVIPTSGTDRIITVGDYNAYFEEDPMDIMRAGGYTVLSSGTNYSYQFDGQIGSIDHALVSTSLNSHITGAAEWNINAAEPVYLDYNDVADDGGSDFANPFGNYYTAVPFRSSDHDPVIIGISLTTPLPVTLTSFVAVRQNNTAVLNWTTAQEEHSSTFIVERSADGEAWKAIAQVAAQGDKKKTPSVYTATDEHPLAGANFYRLKQVDQDGKSVYSPVRKLNFGQTITFRIYPNPAANTLYIAMEGITDGFQVQVVNMMNQLIIRKQLSAGTQPAQLDITALPAGVYAVRIVTADGAAQTSRFVKK